MVFFIAIVICLDLEIIGAVVLEVAMVTGLVPLVYIFGVFYFENKILNKQSKARIRKYFKEVN